MSAPGEHPGHPPGPRSERERGLGSLAWSAVLNSVQVVVIGVAGTMLLNPLRLSLVALIAATVGVTPAILFDDYGGTILFIAYLFAFWTLAQRWLMPGSAMETA